MENVLDLFQTTEEKMLDISSKIRETRKSRGISQELLATMSNVSFGSIKRFERTGEISLYSLLKLTNALKIKISFVNEYDVKSAKLGFYNEK